MDFRTLWLTTPVMARHTMVRRLGSTYKYLQKIAGQFATPSPKLARRMIELYPELTLDELFYVPPKIAVKPGPPRKVTPAAKAPAKKAAAKKAPAKKVPAKKASAKRAR